MRVKKVAIKPTLEIVNCPQSLWVTLPAEIRNEIRRTFGVPRSDQVIVVNGKLISDGSSDQDLAIVSKARMQEYLCTEEKDYMTLFNKLIDLVKKLQAGDKAEAVTMEKLMEKKLGKVKIIKAPKKLSAKAYVKKAKK